MYNQIRPVLLVFLISLISSCFHLAANAAEDEKKPKPFVVKDAFSIETPADGFKWSFVKKKTVGDTTTNIYRCEKAGREAFIELAVLDKKITENAARITAVAANHNDFASMVEKKDKYKIYKLKPEKIKFISIQNDSSIYSRAGRKSYNHLATTIFGTKTYQFKIRAETLTEVQELSLVLDSLNEFGKDKSKIKPLEKKEHTTGNFSLTIPKEFRPVIVNKKTYYQDRTGGQLQISRIKYTGTLEQLVTQIRKQLDRQRLKRIVAEHANRKMKLNNGKPIIAFNTFGNYSSPGKKYILVHKKQALLIWIRYNKELFNGQIESFDETVKNIKFKVKK